MASPSRGPLPNVYDALEDLYLSLWAQIDYLIGENKWLDVEPADPACAAADAQRELAQIEAQFEGERELVTARKDYRRAQRLVTKYAGHAGALALGERAELEQFIGRLQSRCDRYGELAGQT